MNEKMEVVSEDGIVVTVLYAAGECANDGLYGSAPTNINMTFGKIIAENILSLNWWVISCMLFLLR